MKHVAELADILSQLGFTAERADLREGTYWSVYAHPWVGEDERYFDALISVTPLRPEVGARHGLQLAVQRGNTFWLASGATNQRGQAWFKQLPVKGCFNVRLAKPKEEEAAAADALAAASQAAAADALAAAGQEERPRIFYLPDHRVVASLGEDTRGQAVLTIETEAHELAGALVRFELGQQTDEVPLMPTDPPGVWSGRFILDQPFQAVKAEIPTFALVPLPHEGVSKQ